MIVLLMMFPLVVVFYSPMPIQSLQFDVCVSVDVSVWWGKCGGDDIQNQKFVIF